MYLVRRINRYLDPPYSSVLTFIPFKFGLIIEQFKHKNSCSDYRNVFDTIIRIKMNTSTKIIRK